MFNWTRIAGCGWGVSWRRVSASGNPQEIFGLPATWTGATPALSEAGSELGKNRSPGTLPWAALKAGGTTNPGSEREGTPPPVFSARVANKGLMLDAASTTSTLADRGKRLAVNSSIGGRDGEEAERQGSGERHGSEDPPLQEIEGELNAGTLRGEGRGDWTECEESME